MSSRVNLANGRYVVYTTQIIGKGQFGTVFKGKDRQDDDRPIAVKVLPNNVTQLWNKCQDSDLVREIEVMSEVKHKNIVEMLTKPIFQNNQIYILLEFCECGTLIDYMKQQAQIMKNQGMKSQTGGPLSQKQVLRLSTQLLDAMAAIHHKKYMHRDIKPENILIDRFKNVKIADFGIARRVTGNNIFEMEKFSAKGTLYYAAPQVINNEKYSVLCDVWSCGLVIYFMLTGKNLFENCTSNYILRNAQLNLNLNLGPEFAECFRKWLPEMLKYNDNDRIACQELSNIFREQLQKMEGEAWKSQQNSPQNPQKMQIGNNQQNSPQNTQKIMPRLLGISIVSRKPIQQTNAATNTKMELNENQKIEQATKQIQQINIYINLYFKRSRQFLNLLNDVKHFPFYDRSKKYILIFLQAAIAISANNEIANILSKSPIKLPNGRDYDVEKLKQSPLFKNKQMTSQYWLEKSRETLNTYIPMFKQISSQIQKTEFLQFNQVLQNLIDIQYGNLREIKFYVDNYRRFFIKQCRVNAQQLKLDQLRKYYMIIGMTDMDRFMDINQPGASQNIISIRKEESRDTMLKNIKQYQV